jgi:hypothetical protein
MKDGNDLHRAGVNLREYGDQAPRYQPKLNGGAQPKAAANKLIVPAGDFIASFTPPDYIIDGLWMRRYLYALTGRTGDAKTAVLVRMAAHIVPGLPIGKYGVERGRVLYLAGENPDDIRMRWMGLAHEMKFDPNLPGMHFIEGRFSIQGLFERVQAELVEMGGVEFVAVDTSATFFEFEDENDNKQMGAHARLLRSLTTLPGGPTVVAACHPTKHATDENMLPRGGGAFIAELDGNNTCIKKDTVVELHWQGKFRGCDFAPINFELQTLTAPDLIDSKGRSIMTVTARPITEDIKEELEAKAFSDQDQVMMLMHMSPGKSLAKMADALDWTYTSGLPDKTRVNRALATLKEHGLAKLGRNKRWSLTERGKTEAKRDAE